MGGDYRGPSININDLYYVEDDDPMGADADGNHGEGRGGNVLLKSGDVRTVTPDDPDWAASARTTSGGNPAVPPRVFTQRISWGFLGLIVALAGTAWFCTRRRRP